MALWMVARLAETMAGQTAVSSVHLMADLKVVQKVVQTACMRDPLTVAQKVGV